MNQTKVASVERTTPGSVARNLLRRNDISVVIAMLVLFVIFTVTSPSFLTPYNMFNVARTASLYVFVALGQAIVIVIGAMNLSLGAIGGLSVVVTGFCMDRMGFPPIVAILAALAVGGAAGLFNGIIIVKTRLSSFVVTLASSFIFVGLVNGVSRGFPYTKIPTSFTVLGRGDFFNIPYVFILMVATLVVLAYVFKYTVVGRRILATGGNMEAARLSGIRTDNIVLLCNVLSGLFAAVAGLLWVSRMGSAQPATGTDWLIVSFAVSILGGTALNGGEISALGIFASAVMLTLIKNGLIMLNVNVYFEQTFLGVIILLAASVESLRALVSGSRKGSNKQPAKQAESPT